MSKLNSMQELDAWLNGEIDKLFDAVQSEPFERGMVGFSAFKKAITDKILESYQKGTRSVWCPEKENETSETK